MSDELKVSLLQMNMEWENPKVNLEYFKNKIENLDSVDLVVLPEMFSTGFSMNAEELAEPPEGNTFNWMKKMARQSNAAVTGSIIVMEKGSFYNRLYFVLPSGETFKYDKRHTFTLAGEDKVYSAGKEKLIVEFRGWKICPLICYDLRFPVWSRNTEDYDLLIYVANWPKRRVTAWDALLKARAIENMCYCIGVNRTGRDGNDVEYPGHSMIYNGLGEELFQEKTPTPNTFKAVLRKAHIKKIRESFRFLQDRDKFIIT